MGAGIFTDLKLGTCEAGLAVTVLPFMVAMSGPYMKIAHLASLTVMGQFIIMFFLMASSKNLCNGLPNFL
jgi:hypothetical protein